MTVLSSMTGFARTEGATETAAWSWEVKSVNGRNLDIRTRLPYGYEFLDPLIRKSAASRLARGSLTAALSVRQEGGTGRLRLNEDNLAVVLDAIRLVAERAEVDRPRPEAILNLRGVLELAEDPADEDETGLRTALLESFDAAIDLLAGTRAEEGELLRPHFDQQLAKISDLADRAAAVPGHQPDAIRQRLNEQIRLLMEEQKGLDEARIMQEVALLATKADIREEIDRLRAHCRTAQDLIGAGGVVGRRLDHLCQEFNREANTICSKSNDVDMTAIGLELKAVIDQFREQVQNLE
ncbi:MAG: YicC/YloC family endoribonuclease [Pseudomonadota bacterium]